MTVIKDISIEQKNSIVSLRGIVVYDDINIEPVGFLIELKDSIAATLELVREAA